MSNFYARAQGEEDAVARPHSVVRTRTVLKRGIRLETRLPLIGSAGDCTRRETTITTQALRVERPKLERADAHVRARAHTAPHARTCVFNVIIEQIAALRGLTLETILAT